MVVGVVEARHDDGATEVDDPPGGHLLGGHHPTVEQGEVGGDVGATGAGEGADPGVGEQDVGLQRGAHDAVPAAAASRRSAAFSTRWEAVSGSDARSSQ